MSSVWNKVDENQQSIVFDMITTQQLQILGGLQYKYRKVALLFILESGCFSLIILCQHFDILDKSCGYPFDNFCEFDISFVLSISG